MIISIRRKFFSRKEYAPLLPHIDYICVGCFQSPWLSLDIWCDNKNGHASSVNDIVVGYLPPETLTHTSTPTAHAFKHRHIQILYRQMKNYLPLNSPPPNCLHLSLVWHLQDKCSTHKNISMYNIVGGVISEVANTRKRKRNFASNKIT